MLIPEHICLRYKHLLHNGDALKQFYYCRNIVAFVQLMAQWLDWSDLTFEKLLVFLNKQNKSFIVPDLKVFSRYWQPADYNKRNRSINWVPAFQPLREPFYQDDMVLQRGTLLSQLLNPVSKVADMLPQMNELPVIKPTLLIFHWSRCGSTLLGGLYRQLDGVKLLSESMLISAMLVDPDWSVSEKLELLQLGIFLQGQFRHDEHQLVVKCNAWDLQHWPLWLQQFPDAQVLCLGRQPERILASHQRIAGTHMVSVSGIWQHIDPWLQHQELLKGRITVLRLLMHYTECLVKSSGCFFIDYQQLLEQTPQQLIAHLRRKPTNDELHRWQMFRLQDAKQPKLVFEQERTLQPVFTSMEQQQINDALWANYLALLNLV